MSYRLADLAVRLDAEYRGAADVCVTGLQAPENAGEADLVVLLEASWLPAVLASPARAVLMAKGPLPAEIADRHVLQVAQPRAAFAELLRLFYPEPELRQAISPQAALAPDVLLEAPVEIAAFAVLETGVSLGGGSRIGAHAVIGAGCRIGRDCRIGPQVVLAPGTELGDRVVIHAGTIIGADGYGFYQQQGRHHKIPQVGRVRIEDDVEIGANVTIDRATLGETVIGEGSKIDNLVQIGHNVRIGKHCLLISQVGIAGSSRLGDGVTLAGQVGVAGHLNIGDGVVAAGKSGITRDIPAGQRISGFPAQNHRQELRQQAALRRLPEWLDRLDSSL